MNRLTPYAAFFMRLAVGGVFLLHGLTKFHHGIPATASFLHDVGFPFATVFAVILIAIETIGAACVILGIFTRVWALCMAVEMVVAKIGRASCRERGGVWVGACGVEGE